MTNNSRPYVFVSYSRADYEFVKRLISDLQLGNFTVWIDSEKLKPGTRNWEKAIKQALSEAHTALLIASPNSVESNYVSDEIEYAELEGCAVIPIWASGEHWHRCIPLGRGKMQYIDLRGEQYQRNLSVLIRQIISTQNKETSTPIPQLAETQKPNVTIGFNEPRNPYKGLKAFTTADARDFFGRQDLIDTLVDRLKTFPQFLAVVGASGAGKSSVVMAGLIPALRDNAIFGGNQWIYLPPVKPSSRPLEQLADALKSQLKDTSIATILNDLNAKDGLGLYRVVRNIPRPDGARVVLLIDQFEEIFTQTSDSAAREHFIGMIMSAVNEPNGILTTIITLRADFSDRPMQYADFGKLMKDHSEPILPISVAGLRQVIEEPAKLPDVGLELEAGLASELVYEARGQSGGLPLLQFTLDQLFQKREGHTLTSAAYQALGGLNGALRAHAEQTFSDLSEEGKQAARQLFMRLIEPGATEQDTTRRRTAISEFTMTDAAQTQRMQDVINTFVNARLLTAENETLEVSHEALIREWVRLADWLREYRKDVELQQELSEAADNWLERHKPPARLYRDVMLDEALAWAARNMPSQSETEFLTASMTERDRQAQTEHDRQAYELKLAQENAQNARRAETAEHDRALRFRNAARLAAAIAIIAIVGVIAAMIALGRAAEQVTLSELDREQLATLVPGIGQVPPTFVPTLSIDQRFATATQIAILYTMPMTTPPATSNGTTMVLVPTGCFLMGSALNNDERPVIYMCFEKPFWIDMYEVTNSDYDKFIRDGGYTQQQWWTKAGWEWLAGKLAPSELDNGKQKNFTGPRQPRGGISWYEAFAYCHWRDARLPTSAEWEYAARGPDSFQYPWGANWIPDYSVNDSNLDAKYKGESAEVGSIPAGKSWVGAYDMAGNIWEWVQTIYDQTTYPYPYQENDGRNVDDGLFVRDIRGGSWIGPGNIYNRSAYHGFLWASEVWRHIGFRCARSF